MILALLTYVSAPAATPFLSTLLQKSAITSTIPNNMMNDIYTNFQVTSGSYPQAPAPRRPSWSDPIQRSPSGCVSTESGGSRSPPAMGAVGSWVPLGSRGSKLAVAPPSLQGRWGGWVPFGQNPNRQPCPPPPPPPAEEVGEETLAAILKLLDFLESQ